MDKCKVGEHKFESYVVATLPPDESQLEGADVGNALDSQKPGIIVALTARRYLVGCSRCGSVLGGFAATPEEEPGAHSAESSKSAEE